MKSKRSVHLPLRAASACFAGSVKLKTIKTAEDYMADSSVEGGPSLGIKGFDIISFGQINWDGPWHSRNHITSLFARDNRVINVAPPVYIQEPFTRKNIRPALRQIAENLWEYQSPFYLPFTYRRGRMSEWLETLRARHLQRTWSRLGFGSPIYYVWEPTYLDLLNRLPNNFIAYHCYDRYSAFSDVQDPELFQSMERALMLKAGLILATSKALADELSEISKKKTYYIQHGVDFDYFNQQISHAGVRDEISKIPGPRIGYVGRMNDKLDLELVDSITATKTNWSFIFVGPWDFYLEKNKQIFQQLRARPNVYIQGSKTRDQVPDCIRSLDVGIIPYRLDMWVHYGNPLKMYEYLACGKQVVATSIGSTRELSEYIQIASTSEEWIAAIDNCLRTDSNQERERRLNYARINSWEARVRQISVLLEDHMNTSCNGLL
jgi:glycosyltransferase involved in cell wall biosynthesis